MQRVIEFQELGAATIKDTTNAWLGLRKILLAERALKWKERGNIFRECNGKNVQNLQKQRTWIIWTKYQMWIFAKMHSCSHWLWLFVFGIHSVKSGKSKIHIWPETYSRSSFNEALSSVSHDNVLVRKRSSQMKLLTMKWCRFSTH